jgi:hypothetical protein
LNGNVQKSPPWGEDVFNPDGINERVGPLFPAHGKKNKSKNKLGFYKSTVIQTLFLIRHLPVGVCCIVVDSFLFSHHPSNSTHFLPGPSQLVGRAKSGI